MELEPKIYKQSAHEAMMQQRDKKWHSTHWWQFLHRRIMEAQAAREKQRWPPGVASWRAWAQKLRAKLEHMQKGEFALDGQTHTSLTVFFRACTTQAGPDWDLMDYWEHEAKTKADRAELAQTNEAKKNWRKEIKEHLRQGTAKGHMVTKPMEATTLKPVITKRGENPWPLTMCLKWRRTLGQDGGEKPCLNGEPQGATSQELTRFGTNLKPK
jgi:hypothetical protein